jgi:hypothetical protein
LVERWDGNSWIIVASPSNGPHDNQLNGVTCSLTTECIAVGSYANDFGVTQTLIEQWDGNSWKVVPSSNTSNGSNNQLNSITCPSASECWAVGTYTGNNDRAQTLIEHWISPLKVIGVVSRKQHGNAGTFDVNLPLTGSPGVECRGGGPSGSYQIVATVASTVTVSGASVVEGSGTIDSAAVNGSEITISLSGVTNGQTIVVRLDQVSDGTGTDNIDIPMGMLLGDVTRNGVVNSSDISTIKKLSGQTVGPLTFHEDVNANGVINSSDLAAVKAIAGTALP